MEHATRIESGAHARVRVRCEVLHVGGPHVAAAAPDGERARRVQHADRYASADAERHERVEGWEPVSGEVARHGGEPPRTWESPL